MGIYLSKPNTEKSSNLGNNKVLSFGSSSMQGWRMNMEDAHINKLDLTQEISLFAVFDGHGGQEVAKFCEAYFNQYLLANEAFKKGDYKTALEETFLKVD
ncbi:MAG: protein phosphatase 2C family protein [Proteobacteria bacterium]|nr:protein phosphatase 2C family protein [Pseudomonadota bacterium]